ncbi:unnamed protein product [Arctia plantaginis]|uniref:Peptidase A2 domain-containing protein n=1 Tax=Arctia plantaginis TaxID=874455 RepID=A0A8S1AYG0_ARCPL|nr:unnamed protein product [Arctia plantaginis]
MESLNNIQEDIKLKMFKAKTNFKKSPKERLSVSYIETRIDNLDQQWALFTQTHSQIISTVKRSEYSSSEYYKNDVYDSVEEFYVQFKAELKEMLSEDTSKCLSSSQQSCCHSEKVARRVKLPEIKIPMFSGKYSEWQTFRDLFVGLVHEDKSLDDAQKLFYLKGQLSGEAEQLLRNIKVYKNAWEKLHKMYNNRKFLTNGILKRLLNQRSLTSESAFDIKGLINTTSECLDSIKALGVDISSWDILIIHIISAKLDPATKKAWELQVSSDQADELPTFEQFSDFLTGRFRGLENLDTKPRIEKRLNCKSFHIVKSKTTESCAYCSADHKITACKAFSKESNMSRREFAMNKKLCFVCLNSNHSAKYCKNIVRCQVCKRRHHSLLHPSGVSGSVDENSVQENASSTSSLKEEAASSSHKHTAQAEGSSQPVVSCLSTGNCGKTVLLTTAVVQAESKDGSFRMVRALLDQGSQGSFITEAMVQYLGLKKIAANHTVTGVGGDKTVVSRSTVYVNVRSRIDPRFQMNVNAYVLKSVTSLLPVAKVTRVEWVNLNVGDLADPEYHRPNKIDILLGAEVYGQILKEGINRHPNESLLAQDTAFGWILSGICEVENSGNINSHITVMHSTQNDELLRKFWELEAEPLEIKRRFTEEESKCEKFYTATTKRNACGRYVVRLPFRDADPDCKYGESRKIAENRLRGLEFKLGKNITLKNEYTKVINEYLELNHMRKVTGLEKRNKEAVYLPHHAVVREDKTTTKVRVVFDASCKGTNGRSLNDDLMVGPSLQAELRHTIMCWRKYKICLVADIIKMYRQVLVDSRDSSFQRILWRENPEDDIEEYELVTVTFGTASAPYLAVRTLQQVANDECQNSPEISRIVLNDFYMDDLMTGAENIETCFNIYSELTRVLLKGGFQLQKWISNSKELLDKIRKVNKRQDEDLKIRADNITKILGLTWNPREDVFQYKVDLAPLSKPATKRKIISDISRLFDPLGWLAPCIIVAKILIQKLWLSGIKWDQEVPSNLLREWMTYRQNLPSLENMKIPRWMNTSNNLFTRELHGFADASKLAYAAVVYLRVMDEVGNVHISLIASKTKVAPLKQVSIPRLELCGAVLLSKLMVEVAEVLGIHKDNLHAYTDSEVVLAWLYQHPSRWKTFVANRVSEILTTLDTQHWHHVASKENPADCASRGIAPQELSITSIWVNGPDFLKESEIDYKRPRHLVTSLEQTKAHTAVVDIDWWQKFSSLTKLVRVVAYCRRFLNLRKKSATKPRSRFLTRQEIDVARELCIKKCQEEGLHEELQELKDKGCLAKGKKKMKSLNLFLDVKGIVRVGGRLEMSKLNYSEKHPILIPKESFLTDLLIADAHQKTMHGGPQLMITYLRSMYWIVGLKGLVKKYVRKCITCIRYSTRATTQLMGQLPSSRVTPNKPFLISGVDYAGPIRLIPTLVIVRR